MTVATLQPGSNKAANRLAPCKGVPIKRERVRAILVAAIRRPFDLLQRSMQVIRASAFLPFRPLGLLRPRLTPERSPIWIVSRRRSNCMGRF